jgi:tRNA (cytidine32/uridine32-2'-O)-methyltransferase
VSDGRSALAQRLAEDVVFLLMQPQHPGNVGAVARAMKNFGLRRLVVIDPPPSFDIERARWMAPGADDILASMTVHATLDEAVADLHLLVGTTARHRADDQPVWEPPRWAEAALDRPTGQRVGVLFGREDLGLSREQTLRCGALVRIPTDHHASLNLGQAALLMASAMFETARSRGLHAEGRIVGGRTGPRSTASLTRRDGKSAPATLAEMEPALADLVGILGRVGYLKSTSPEKVVATLREALQKAQPTRRQISAVRGMVHRVAWGLDNPDACAANPTPTEAPEG